jgi:hypothetical protein
MASADPVKLKSPFSGDARVTLETGLKKTSAPDEGAAFTRRLHAMKGAVPTKCQALSGCPFPSRSPAADSSSRVFSTIMYS